MVSIREMADGMGDFPIPLPLPEIEQKESIKLIKNTKGYNWEIKVFPKTNDEDWIARLEWLNDKCCELFNKGAADSDD